MARYRCDTGSRLTSLDAAINGTSLGNLTYTYDPAGHVTPVNEFAAGQYA